MVAFGKDTPRGGRAVVDRACVRRDGRSYEGRADFLAADRYNSRR